MKKFSKVFLIILAIFILGGLGSQYFYKPSIQDYKLAEQQASNTIAGYQSLTTLSKAIEKYQLQDNVQDIEIVQEKNKDAIIVHMLRNGAASEQSLLQDTYNIINASTSNKNIGQLTFIWHIPEQNKTYMQLTIEYKEIQNLNSYSYTDLPALAKQYSIDSSFN